MQIENALRTANPIALAATNAVGKLRHKATGSARVAERSAGLKRKSQSRVEWPTKVHSSGCVLFRTIAR